MRIKKYIPANIKIALKRLLNNRRSPKFRPEYLGKQPPLYNQESINYCLCCGSLQINYTPILWDELIRQWDLKDYEIEYINRQQGIHCSRCKTNLRTMSIAHGMMRYEGYWGLFQNFVRTRKFRKKKILEINKAGFLTQYLDSHRGHILAEYPEFDMQCLPYPDSSFDITLHSDTLEHIPDPIKALEECRRVLKPDGYCIFTVPIILDRLTISRAGLPPSFHGSQQSTDTDLLVQTEFGADAWKYVQVAGFSEVRIYSLEYPGAQSLLCKK